MQEKWIIELYLSRDEEALRYTEAVYGDYCRGLISRFLTDKADVEACLSDLWQKVWESIPPANPPSLQLYLAATARALAVARSRTLPPKKRGDAPALPEGELDGCLPDGLSRGEAATHLDGYLSALPETERRLFVGRYWYALPVSELAALWDMAEAEVTACLERARDGLRALSAEGEAPAATGGRVMDALGDVSKKYVREAEPLPLTALIDTRVRRVDAVRRYQGKGIYVPPIGYKMPPRPKPLRPAKRWMTVLGIAVMAFYMLTSLLVGLLGVLISTAEPTDVPGVYIIAGVEVDLPALFGLNDPPETGGDVEETTAPPIRYPCVEEGHILTVWEDREATCYAVSHYKATCDRCAFETEVFGTERPPHANENGVCTVCGLLEGAHDVVTAQLYERDGVREASVTKVEDVVGYELLLPNVCFVEGYGLLPVTRWEATIPRHIVTLVVPEGYRELLDVTYRDDNINLRSVTLPSTLETIGYGCFSDCTALTELVLSEGLRNIGGSAFSGCTALTDVTLPDSVVFIGNEAFKGCTKLKLSRLPVLLTELGASAFEGCGAITVSAVPDGVTKIENRTFLDCTSIPSMTLPANLISIGEFAFYNCSSMASVNIPEGVNTLSKYAFSRCRALTELTLSERLWSVEDSALAETGLVRLTVPASVRSMARYALYGCNKLTEVVFEGEKTTLGVDLFRECTALSSVVLPAGLESLSQELFYNCSSLTELEIPNSVTSIGDGAFQGCGKLQKVHLPVKLKEYQYAFDGCGALRELTMDEGGAFYTVRGNCLIAVNSKTLVFGTSAAVIPDDGSVVKIGSYAFQGRGVETIVIPEGVTTVGDRAFANCTKLTSLTVSSTVESIGDYALSGCTALSEIYADMTVSQWRILSAGNMADVKDGRWSFTAYCTDGYLNLDRSAVYYEEEETAAEGQ